MNRHRRWPTARPIAPRPAKVVALDVRRRGDERYYRLPGNHAELERLGSEFFR
jgi:hypothetical protein